jgi:hypothetical protein
VDLLKKIPIGVWPKSTRRTHPAFFLRGCVEKAGGLRASCAVHMGRIQLTSQLIALLRAQLIAPPNRDQMSSRPNRWDRDGSACNEL